MSDEIGAALKRAAVTVVSPEDYDVVGRAAERRRSRRRTYRATLAVVLVAATSLVAWRWLADPGGGDGRTGTASPGVSNALRVPGIRTGGTTEYAVTFLDGSTARLGVPAAAGLDDLAVRPGGGARLPGVADRDFVVPAGGVAWFSALGPKTRELARTAGKVVSLWSVTGNDGPSRYLVFDFGAWVVGVWDGAGGATMTDAQLQTWADSLDGRITADGFLVLTARAPLELLGAGTGAAPALRWGDDAGRGLGLRLGPCASAVDDLSGSGDDWLATLCRPAWGAHVEVQGPRDFVDSVTGGVTVTRGGP